MHDIFAQLDKHKTAKPVMVSCEFNFHWRQLFAQTLNTPQCQFCTKMSEISNLFYLLKPFVPSDLLLFLKNSSKHGYNWVGKIRSLEKEIHLRVFSLFSGDQCHSFTREHRKHWR